MCVNMFMYVCKNAQHDDETHDVDGGHISIHVQHHSYTDAGSILDYVGSYMNAQQHTYMKT